MSTKVLYIITQSEQGGAQRYVADFANNLPSEKYDIHIAAGSGGWLFKRAQIPQENKHTLKHLVRPINPLKDMLAVFEIFRLVKKIRPHVVHLNSTKAGVVGAIGAKLAGVKKVVYTAHGFVFLEPMPSWKKKLYIWAEKFSGRFKDVIICVSNFDKQQGLKYNIAPEKKFVVIYNGIDTIPFLSRQDARKEIEKRRLDIHNEPGLRFGDDTIIIGAIANFYPTKGLTYFIEAAKDVSQAFPNLEFVLIGEGEERNRLEDTINGFGMKNFHLLGETDNFAQYLKAFNIYVSASIKEGFPYSLLEAMAAKLPIVSTNVGGVPEMFYEKCAILIPPKSPQDITKGIIHLIQNAKHSQDLAESAYAKVEKDFNLRQMLDATVLYYQ